MAHTAIRLGYISTSGGGGGIVEFANLAAFPAIGQGSLVYLALDTKKIYKWSSGAYLLISPSEVTSVNTEVGAVVLDKTDIGLGNVDNTSDVNKPISSATQTALNAKQDSLGFTPENVTNKTTNTSLGTSDTLYPTQNAVKSYVDTQITNNATPDATTLVKGKVKLAGDLAGTADLPTVPGLAGKEPTITAGTTTQYYRGDKTFQTLDKSAVGLSNVDNTSDANKPISSATQTALNAKVDTVLVGAINGVASLDGTGKVPSTQLPSYVDDVLEFANLAAFPVTGETGKIYIALDTNKCYRWSGSVYIEVSQGITDHTLLSNIGTNTHANIDTHIAATSAVHGVTGSVVGTSDSQALTNKTIDADLNTLSNIENADIKAAAAIARTKLASSTANRIVINDGTGVMADAAAITASRALVSDANGIPTASAVTSTELGYVSGVTSAIQTQINGKQNSLGFTPEDVANKSITTSLGTSDTLYPTQNAVKTYVDNAVTGGATPDATTLIKGKVKLAGDLAGTADLPTVPGLATKEPTITATTSADYYRGDKTFQTLNKAAVGLSNVDNTSDADKPISSATQTALNAKENAITAGTTSQYWRGDKSFQTLDKTAVGLANVDNTSDLDKPISTATATALSGKANTSHVHALTDLTQSSATSGQVPSWNGTNWVPVTPSPGVTDHTLLTNIGTNTHTQIDTFMANTTNIHTESKEPTGFFSRTTSTLSFDNGTRNFSITPTGATFEFWVKGVKYTKTGAQTIQIPALSGNHFVYFDATGTLATTQAAGPELFIDNALISIIYWNTDTNTRTYFAEERHGMQMDGATHSYLHTVFGAQFISGLALQGFSVDGDGSSNTHAQFTSDSGTIRDEDIILALSAQTQIPVLYRQGLLWRKKAADAFPFIYSGTAGYTGANGRLPFNEFTGGAWQLTQIANNAFVLVHLFGTNDIENPVVAIQGIATYGNVTAARLAASSEITSLSGLPFAEFVALGSVVLESANAYTNTPKAVVRSVDGTNYVDFRGTQLYTPAGEVTTHGLLSGLSSDDHLQYHTDTRGDIRYYTKAEVDTIISNITSPGDLDDTAFSLANNQTSPANVTGFAFANATVRSFNALVSVFIDATTDFYEVFEIKGIQKGSEWDFTISSQGDVSGVAFSITNSGQVQYTSTNISGFASGVIKFRALTTSV